jgi:hypothetical protein
MKIMYFFGAVTFLFSEQFRAQIPSTGLMHIKKNVFRPTRLYHQANSMKEWEG